MEVMIDGVRFVRADTQPNDEAMRLLNRVYGALWTEAYYDPYNDETRKFAKPLADLMSDANKLLKFKA